MATPARKHLAKTITRLTQHYRSCRTCARSAEPCLVGVVLWAGFSASLSAFIRNCVTQRIRTDRGLDRVTKLVKRVMDSAGLLEK